MAKSKLSAKRLEIDKSNASLVVIVSIATFVAVFCLVSIKSLLDQRAYQASVESQKETALAQLQQNIQSVDQLTVAYNEFEESEEKVLGGDSNGKGDRDGSNSKIVLDALPSKYDFPALATSLEKILKDNNYKIEAIAGSDEELSQSGDENSGETQPVEMPFTVEATANQQKSRQLLQLFERSIRPILIQKVTIESEENRVRFIIDGLSYYQPEKGLGVKTEVVQ